MPVENRRENSGWPDLFSPAGSAVLSATMSVSRISQVRFCGTVQRKEEDAHPEKRLITERLRRLKTMRGLCSVTLSGLERKKNLWNILHSSRRSSSGGISRQPYRAAAADAPESRPARRHTGRIESALCYRQRAGCGLHDQRGGRSNRAVRATRGRPASTATNRSKAGLA